MAAEERLHEEAGHFVGDRDDPGEQDDPEDRPLAQDDAEAFEHVANKAGGPVHVGSRVGRGDRRRMEAVGTELGFGPRRFAQQERHESGGGHGAGSDQEDGLEPPETGHGPAKQRRAEQGAGHQRLGATHVLFVLSGTAEDAQTVVEQGVTRA